LAQTHPGKDIQNIIINNTSHEVNNYVFINHHINCLFKQLTNLSIGVFTVGTTLLGVRRTSTQKERKEYPEEERRVPRSWRSTMLLESPQSIFDPVRTIGTHCGVHHLPPYFVDCFYTLTKSFHNAVCSKQTLPPNLFGTSQHRAEKGKSLQTFINKFGKVALKIRNLNLYVLLSFFLCFFLLPSQIFYDFYKFYCSVSILVLLKWRVIFLTN